LPKRTNIILTTKADHTLNTINPNTPKYFPSLKSAEHYCSLAQIDKLWIIGGEMLYKEALQYDKLHRIYVTYIDKDFECDTFFPEIPDDFELELESMWFSENDINFKYETYITKNRDNPRT
jgi:dihydrofolate reductase